MEMKPKALKLIEKHGTLLLILMIVIFSLLYSLLSIRRHLHFDSFAYDLGIFDQTIWKYSQFKIPFNTIKGKFIFGDHFSPSLVLLAPLFWLWDDVRALLVFQAIWLASSSYPIFLLAKSKRLPTLTCLAVSGLYLTFFGFQHALNFDFHEIVLAAGLACWLIYFWDKKDWLKFSLLAILFVGLKENLALIIFALGLVSLWRKQKKEGILMGFFSLLYFFLVVKFVIPLFSPIGYEYQPTLPENLLSLVQGMFWPEVKLETWFYSLAWFSFLPLFAPQTLIPVIIDLAQHFLAGEKYAGTWGLFMHYRASLGPFLAWGAIEGLAFLKRKASLLPLTFLIVLPAIFFQYYLHLPLNQLSKQYFWQEEDYMRNNNKLFSFIKKEDSVVAQNNLVPHLSHREEIYLLWPRKNEDQWWLFWAGKPKYLIVDLHSNQAITHLLINSEVELKEAVENMEEEGILNLVESVGESRLYRINYED